MSSSTALRTISSVQIWFESHFLATINKQSPVCKQQPISKVGDVCLKNKKHFKFSTSCPSLWTTNPGYSSASTRCYLNKTGQASPACSTKQIMKNAQFLRYKAPKFPLNSFVFSISQEQRYSDEILHMDNDYPSRGRRLLHKHSCKKQLLCRCKDE